jgi:uncharacterized protein (TIGR03085 family)
MARRGHRGIMTSAVRDGRRGESRVGTRDVLRSERAALCDTLVQFGPNAPTLCEGWTTADLAAHLIVRERDPRAGPGLILGGAFARYTERLMAKEKTKGFDAMVARLRSGPPGYMVATMPGVNVNENWIHHEDIRRANGEGPRPEDPALTAVLVAVLARLGRLQTRAVKPHGVRLALPDGTEHVLRTGDDAAVLRGPIGECALYLSGRRAAAQVELDGAPAAVEALRTASLGV